MLDVGAQVLRGVVGAEEHGVRRLGGAEPVPQPRLLALEQPLVDRRCTAQQPVAQPQVVAALHPYAGSEQRGIPPRGVVPDPTRTDRCLALGDVRRQVGELHHVLRAVVDHPYALGGQPGELDARHGDTFPHPSDGGEGRPVLT